MAYPVERVAMGAVYLHICDRRTGAGGKAQTSRERGARILIDDGVDIAREAEQAGVLCYQVIPIANRKRFGTYEPQVRGFDTHLPAVSLTKAVNRVIADDSKGIGSAFVLDKKLRLLDEQKLW